MGAWHGRWVFCFSRRWRGWWRIGCWHRVFCTQPLRSPALRCLPQGHLPPPRRLLPALPFHRALPHSNRLTSLLHYAKSSRTTSLVKTSEHPTTTGYALPPTVLCNKPTPTLIAPFLLFNFQEPSQTP